VSKPFSEDDLAEQLSRDITWRVREISDLKSAIRAADNIAQTALLRATLAICYAHWEGHVRFSARKYLTHIALRKLTFSTLAPQFLRNEFLPRLSTMGQKSIRERGEIVDLILSSGANRFSRVNEDLINTQSNLNSEVLLNICRICGIDADIFEDKSDFIDVILLKRRNAIAHGEDTFIAVTELDELTDGTIELMRLFSNQLQASAYLRSYRVA
jgi:hypothetical protein